MTGWPCLQAALLLHNFPALNPRIISIGMSSRSQGDATSSMQGGAEFALSQ